MDAHWLTSQGAMPMPICRYSKAPVNTMKARRAALTHMLPQRSTKAKVQRPSPMMVFSSHHQPSFSAAHSLFLGSTCSTDSSPVSTKMRLQMEKA